MDTLTTKKATFKRQEVFSIGTLIADALTPPGATRCYLPDHSDTTVAQAATQKLNRTVSPNDVLRVRRQVFGKLAGEGRNVAEAVGALTQTISNQAVAIKKLTDRLAAIERQVNVIEDELTAADEAANKIVPRHEPQRNGHGYIPPRGR